MICTLPKIYMKFYKAKGLSKHKKDGILVPKDGRSDTTRYPLNVFLNRKRKVPEKVPDTSKNHDR